MRDLAENYKNSIAVAKMYYYQGLTTEKIADELKISRPTISRLLSFAREKGLVEITVHDSSEYLNTLELELKEKYGIENVHIVSVPEASGEQVWLHRVASFAANYLNSIVDDNQILGLSWGGTLSTVGRYLVPKALKDFDIVQLNGTGNARTINNTFANEIVLRFADNYSARANLFPVPTLFDFEQTKQAMWRERSIRRVLDLQQKADILLYSIGAIENGTPGLVLSENYFGPRDFREVKKRKIVGDIATVFFCENGSYEGISLNKRSSGPDLSLFKKVAHSICVVSGRSKALALRSALAARYMHDLIVDEPTARLVMKSGMKSPLSSRLRKRSGHG
jgi:DNA-binding transcriptional regulator LsrR (DeoR family)